MIHGSVLGRHSAQRLELSTRLTWMFKVAAVAVDPVSAGIDMCNADDGARHPNSDPAGDTSHEELSKYHALAVQRLTVRGLAAFFGSQVQLFVSVWDDRAGYHYRV